MEERETLSLEESYYSGLANDTRNDAMEKDDIANHTFNECKTPKKSKMLIDSERLLDKINILTTKLENTSACTKVNHFQWSYI